MGVPRGLWRVASSCQAPLPSPPGRWCQPCKGLRWRVRAPGPGETHGVRLPAPGSRVCSRCRPAEPTSSERARGSIVTRGLSFSHAHSCWGNKERTLDHGVVMRGVNLCPQCMAGWGASSPPPTLQSSACPKGNRSGRSRRLHRRRGGLGQSLQLSHLVHGRFAHRLLLRQRLGPLGSGAGRVRALLRSTRWATLWLEPPPVSLIRRKGLEGWGNLPRWGAGKCFGRVPLQGPPPLTEGTPGDNLADT